jgi:hypothetical protein
MTELKKTADISHEAASFAVPTFIPSDFEPVDRANPRSTDFGQPVRLARKKGKDGDEDVFTFGRELAGELNLQANSLRQWNGKKGTKGEGSVVIAVCPGNTGRWMRNGKGEHRKGLTHKNMELAAMLDRTTAPALKGVAFLDLELMGTDGVNRYYKVVKDVTHS